jgi:hypothetical protein
MEGKRMFTKKILINLLTLFLVFLLFSPAKAEWRTIQVFKKVDVPFNMIHEDLIMQKGQFDFEILSERSLNIFQLKIYKKGKSLCAVTGKVLREGLPGARGEEMEEVPVEPTLQMKRIPVKKAVYIIFETGQLTEMFPGFVIRFELGYE